MQASQSTFWSHGCSASGSQKIPGQAASAVHLLTCLGGSSFGQRCSSHLGPGPLSGLLGLGSWEEVSVQREV